MSARGKGAVQLGALSPAFALVSAFFVAIVLLCLLVLGPKTEALENGIADAQSDT